MRNLVGQVSGVALALATLSPGAWAQDTHDHSAPDAPATAPAHPAAEGKADIHDHGDSAAPKTPTLLTGYGNGGFAASHATPQAQAFFANGLELHAAFAHKTAIAAMTEAVRLDPTCAMCHWGLALTDGPTINYGKDAKERAALLPGALAAQRLAKTGTAKERALTAALVQRYAKGDPHQRDIAYAKAMEAVAASLPDDNEVQILTADALMVSAFRDQSSDFDHAPIERAVALCEKVLVRAPEHTPAIHFYIHATEVLGKPELAESYADRLESLAPHASHLVHMPSHTYYWVGRYQDAADSNRRAVEIGKANAKALGLPGPMGVWGLPYHMHNVLYGLGGALMSGDSRTALDLGRPLVEVAAARDKAGGGGQVLAALGYYALARFDPVAALATPEPKLPYLKAVRHYARGEAMAWEGDLAGAKAELAAIPASVATGDAMSWPDDGTKAAEQMLGVTRAVLEGRIAMAEKRYGDAASAFRRGAAIEETKDFSDFTDPPAFWYPVRRDLAAALLASGDAAGAQREAEASLALRKLDPEAERVLAASRLALSSARAR